MIGGVLDSYPRSKNSRRAIAIDTYGNHIFIWNLFQATKPRSLRDGVSRTMDGSRPSVKGDRREYQCAEYQPI